jgi:hypothetical protein
MVAVTVMLAASIVALWVHNDRRFEGSISAYYYTQAHAVFLAAVCALGICLIAYKGQTPTEEVLLDVSGMLAFVVALVPTKGENIIDPKLPTLPDASAGVENNIWALLIAITAGLGLYCGYAAAAKWRGLTDDPEGRPGGRNRQIEATFAGYATRVTAMAAERPRLNAIAVSGKWFLPAVSVLIVLAGIWWFLTDLDGFILRAHGSAAAVMFGGLTVVVLHYAVYATRRIKEDSTRLKYAVLYVIVAIVMLATVILAVCAYRQHPEGDLKIFSYEVVLIAAFSAFWLVQTWDLWRRDPYAD